MFNGQATIFQLEGKFVFMAARKPISYEYFFYLQAQNQVSKLNATTQWLFGNPPALSQDQLWFQEALQARACNSALKVGDTWWLST